MIQKMYERIARDGLDRNNLTEFEISAIQLEHFLS